MLSYVGLTILGVNSVQLYMKVPGSRTPGFALINLLDFESVLSVGQKSWLYDVFVFVTLTTFYIMLCGLLHGASIVSKILNR